MSTLTVNLDYVAALREAGRSTEPDPAQAAVLVELAGADGVAVRVRRDRKQIRNRDLFLLKGVCKSKVTVEMPPTEEIIERVLEVKPWMITLVADHADGDSPVSPINFGEGSVDFDDLVARCKGVGVNTCYFVEPVLEDIKGAIKGGATAVLVNCLGYTQARTMEDAQTELDRLDKAAQAAAKSGLAVHFGRGLNYQNIGPLVELNIVDEFVIGHSICSRAMLVGFDAAVREARSIIGRSSDQR